MLLAVLVLLLVLVLLVIPVLLVGLVLLLVPELVYLDIKTLMRLCTHTIRDIHVSVGFVPGWFQIGFWPVWFQGGSRRACPGWFEGVSRCGSS